MAKTAGHSPQKDPIEDYCDAPGCPPPPDAGARLVRVAATLLASDGELRVVTASWVSRVTSHLLDD